MKVSFERTLFYLSVLAITKTVSFDHSRNQKCRNGDHMAHHEPTYYKDTRNKRVPFCRSSAQLPHMMSVSRPGRLGEGSLASSGEADRYKEVVHIPCPKRMSNSRSVAALRGQQELLTSEITENNHLLRVAPDTKCQEHSLCIKTNQNSGQPTDLNQAVKQNQQWLISNQGGPQPQIGQNRDLQVLTANPIPSQVTNNQQNRRASNEYQQQAISDRYYIGQGSSHHGVLPNTPIETYKSPQKPVNTNKYDLLSSQQHLENRRIKMKFDGFNNSASQTQQIAGFNGQYASTQMIQKPQDPAPNAGLSQLPASLSDIKTPPALPHPRSEIVLPGAHESYRYLTNAYNLTYEAPSNILQQICPPNQLPANSNLSHELIPLNLQALNFHSPNNSNRGINYGLKLSNPSMSSVPPLNYNGYNSVREQESPPSQYICNKHDHGQSSKGEFEVKNSMNAKENPSQPQGQLEVEAGNHDGVHGMPQQPQAVQNTKPSLENWKEFNNLHSERSHEQSQRNALVTVSNPVDNKEKTVNQINVEKPAHGLAAIKGLFGKHNKEELKGRQVTVGEPKLPKSKGHNENQMTANNALTGNQHEIAEKGYVSKNGKAVVNGKGGVMVVLEKTNRLDNNINNGYGRKVDYSGQNNNVMKHDHHYNQMDVLKGHQVAQASIDQRHVMENMNLQTDIKNHDEPAEIICQNKRGNVSRTMLHILSPPVSVEPHLFTNQGLKVVSKVPVNAEVTYHSFMGYAPARNDEAFYDKKNMNFLGPIDHPPLINLKCNKAEKPEKRIKPANKNFKRVPGKYKNEFYSQAAGFHSDKTAEDVPRSWKRFKQARLARKCPQNHKTFWQHLKGQDKRGLHRSKVPSFRSV